MNEAIQDRPFRLSSKIDKRFPFIESSLSLTFFVSAICQTSRAVIIIVSASKLMSIAAFRISATAESTGCRMDRSAYSRSPERKMS